MSAAKTTKTDSLIFIGIEVRIISWACCGLLPVTVAVLLMWTVHLSPGKQEKGYMQNFGRLETPWTIRHTEGHLILGPISKKLPFAWIIFFITLISVIDQINNQSRDLIFYCLAVIGLLSPYFLRKTTYRQQAILGWILTKVTIGLLAFIMVLIGPIKLLQGEQDALPLLFLGLIWFPTIEFIPTITKWQKQITAGRLLLSIPCVYFGVMSGNWYWR